MSPTPAQPLEQASWDLIVDQMARTVGPDHVLRNPDTTAYSVDGVEPEIVVRPQNAEEISTVMRTVREAGLKAVAFGSGTLRGLGNPPTAMDVGIDLTRLDRVIDYQPEDLTVTVEAGVTLGALQGRLAERGQFLPIDPPVSTEATIGGLVATNGSGPLRLVYGTIRDHLIGIKVVRSNGDLTKSGGQVVKNVAGYQLHKLYTGSLGTLGIIVEATFRLRPLPESKALLRATIDGDRRFNTAEKSIAAILASDVAPALLELISNAEHITFVAGFAGAESAVRWQVRRARDIVAAAADVRAEEFPWDEVYGEVLERHAIHHNRTVRLKANMRSSEVCSFMEEAIQVAYENAATVEQASHAANGIVRIDLDGTTAALTAIIDRLTDSAVEKGGNLVLAHGPLELKRLRDVWGAPRNDLFLMKALKEKLDPGSLLNPGRFVGGI